MPELAPSLLAADLMRLGEEIQSVLDCGVKLLHFDVMDAHFVPNLSFGPALCRRIHEAFPQCLLDVHLMMDNPEKYIAAFADAGVYAITVHAEIPGDVGNVLRAIRAKGVKCGLSVKPGTDVETFLPYLNEMDVALIMTVEPGFGGQKFMPEQAEKIRWLRQNGFTGEINVDGGVSPANVKMLTENGATWLVMGTGFFKAADRKAVADCVRELA